MTNENRVYKKPNSIKKMQKEEVQLIVFKISVFIMIALQSYSTVLAFSVSWQEVVINFLFMYLFATSIILFYMHSLWFRRVYTMTYGTVLIFWALRILLLVYGKDRQLNLFIEGYIIRVLIMTIMMIIIYKSKQVNITFRLATVKRRTVNELSLDKYVEKPSKGDTEKRQKAFEVKVNAKKDMTISGLNGWLVLFQILLWFMLVISLNRAQVYPIMQRSVWMTTSQLALLFLIMSTIIYFYNRNKLFMWTFVGVATIDLVSLYFNVLFRGVLSENIIVTLPQLAGINVIFKGILYCILIITLLRAVRVKNTFYNKSLPVETRVNNKLKGLGGWMVFLQIHLYQLAFKQIIFFLILIAATMQRQTLSTLLYFAEFILIVLTLVLFYIKRKTFKVLYILLMFLNAVVTYAFYRQMTQVIDLHLVYTYLQAFENEVYYIEEIIWTFMMMGCVPFIAIILAIFISKRVKNTFIK